MNKLKKYKFSKLYDMGSGISSKPDQAGHGFPFVSFSTVFNNHFLPKTLPDLMDTSEKERETYSVKEGDIFLTRTSETLDELGMSSVATHDIPNATYSGFLKRLRPNQNNVCYHKFMAFYLRSKLFRKTMNNNAVMTLRASLNEQIFSYLDLLLPGYTEQKKIGDYLYLINEKIELNNKINTELETIAKLIYDYWFVQFDFPDAHGKPYKSSGGKMVYNKTLKREIPEGWQGIPLSKIIEVSKNSINPANFPDKTFKLFSIPTLDATSSYTLDIGKNIGSSKFIVTYQHILVSKLNPWFNRVVYTNNVSDQICSTEFVVWQSTSLYTKNFLYMIAKSQQFIEFCIQAATGTSNSHKRVNPTVMMDYKIAYNKDTVESLGTKLEPILKKIIRNNRENIHLAELRDWLLPMLMNGQVTVKGTAS